jgi:hypothetical protein
MAAILGHTPIAVFCENTVLYDSSDLINLDFKERAMCGDLRIRLTYPEARYRGATIEDGGWPKFL